jgi:hypothetical protein
MEEKQEVQGDARKERRKRTTRVERYADLPMRKPGTRGEGEIQKKGEKESRFEEPRSFWRPVAPPPSIN